MYGIAIIIPMRKHSILWMPKNNRYNGFLTQVEDGDRNYLYHDSPDLSQKAEEEKLRRIGLRLEAALEDFSILFNNLDNAERKPIFEAGDSRRENRISPLHPAKDLPDEEYEWDFLGGWKGPDFNPIDPDQELARCIADTIGFLWLACYDAHVNPEQVLESGIDRAMQKINRDRSVDITIQPSVLREERRQKAIQGRKNMARGEELSDSQARGLLECSEGIVPAGLVFDYLRGKIDSHELQPLPFEDADDTIKD
jgi:hypothetical protein